MIQHKIGDLFASNADIIAHQVNCQGVMGSGVAKQVREKYPGTFQHYKRYCRESAPEKLLGCTLITAELRGKERIYIASLFAQNRYGYDGQRYTDYEAFRECLVYTCSFARAMQREVGKVLKIALPYRIGCDRGGGNWDTVYKIIEEELGDLDVTLYELPSNAPGGFNGKKDCQHG